MTGPSPAANGRLERPGAPALAYRRRPGRAPTVVFLPGYASDMGGTKASALETACAARGLGYVAFDYRGHGLSGGRFEEATLGDWLADARAVVEAVAPPPVVLVGSSMGGWIGLLLARDLPERVAGLVGVGTAADFTEDHLPAKLGDEGRAALERHGVVRVPSPHGPEPTTITARMLAEARAHLVLRGPLPVRCPVRLIHGEDDADVPWRVSLAVLERIETRDAELVLVKGGEHRLSRPRDLRRLERVLDGLVAELDAGAADRDR